MRSRFLPLSLVQNTNQMNIKKYLLLPLLLFSFVAVQGQDVKDRSINQAENKANNRVDNKVNEGLDKGFDAIEGLFKKKKKKNKGTSEESSSSSEASGNASGGTYEPEEEVQEETPVVTKQREADPEQERKKQETLDMYNQMLGGMFQPAQWEDSYLFSLVSEATVTTTDKSGKKEVNYMNWFASETAFGMLIKESQGMDADGYVVFDFGNNSFITLTEREGKKEGMAIAMNEEQKSIMGGEYQQKVNEEYEDVEFFKTGRSKMIADLLSWEYEGRSKEGNGTMWVCEDIKFDSEKYFGLFGNSSGRKDFMPDNYPEGYLMEMNYTDSETGETHHYIVTRLEQDADEKIDTKPYGVKDMQQMLNEGQR